MKERPLRWWIMGYVSGHIVGWYGATWLTVGCAVVCFLVYWWVSTGEMKR